MFKAERIDPAIRERVWVLPDNPGLTSWDGIFQVAGTAVIEDDAGETWLEANTFWLTQASPDRKLRLRAGGESVHITVSEQLITSAIGRSPEAMDLRRLIETPLAVSLENRPHERRKVEETVLLLLEESGSQRPGAGTMVEAGLKILLISLLRALGETRRKAAAPDRGTWHLQQFRRLLETHFRERWTVGRYAQTMGIGPDRLHDLCTEKLDRPPRELIRDRVIVEAQTMLTSTALTVSEISVRLGFRDPGHFGKFFSRSVGLAPGAFRKQRARRSEEQADSALTFADWP